MIQNERQYQVTKDQAEKFEKTLEQMLQSPVAIQNKNPLLWQAQVSAVESQLSDLREEIEDYEATRDGLRIKLVSQEFTEDVKQMQRELVERGTPKFSVFLITLRVTFEIILSFWIVLFEIIFLNSANKKVE